jgi:hypothetical protein
MFFWNKKILQLILGLVLGYLDQRFTILPKLEWDLNCVALFFAKIGINVWMRLLSHFEQVHVFKLKKYNFFEREKLIHT